MPYVKIRLTGRGMDKFHGDIAGEAFKDGVSVNAMPQNIADRIAATHAALVVDPETGEDSHQAGVTHRMVGGVSIPVETPEKMRTATEEELAAEFARKAAKRGLEGLVFYTPEQLEEIAKTEGINGLREVAKPYAVKARDITKLIAAIIMAQEAYKVASSALEKERQEGRKRALAESLAAQAKREAEIAEQGKSWSPDIEKFETNAERKARLEQDQTPNAVGEGGAAVFVDPAKPKVVDNAEAQREGGKIVVNDVVNEGGAGATVVVEDVNANHGDPVMDVVRPADPNVDQKAS